MAQARTSYHKEIKTASFQGRTITVENLTPNRLYITLDATDTYTMHFFKYTAGHLNKKTFAWIEDKTVEVRTASGVFCDSLQAIFTEVRLYGRVGATEY